MRIVLKGANGNFEIGGGAHANARLLDIQGIGLPSKEVTAAVFAGQSGQSITSVRDSVRTITMSFDFYVNPRTTQKLYGVLYAPVEICFCASGGRYRITGQCRDATDAERIIYHSWNKIAVQFVCDDPYFHDMQETKIAVASYVNNFPNAYEDGKWLVSLPAVATERLTRISVENKGVTKIYPKISVKKTNATVGTSSSYGLKLINHTTGKTLEIDYRLTGTSDITVDLPRRKITDGNTNITPYISDDTVLSDFYLTPGENDIEVVTLDNADLISVDLTFNNNYIGVAI